ncbi:MAG: HlyD family secretion protein [bacterium]
MEKSVSNEISDSTTPPPGNRHGPRWVFPVVLLIIIVVGGPFGYKWWRELITTVSTDNATIQGRVVAISGKIAGTVIGVDFSDNQRVKTGDVLIRLDRRDLDVAMDQAKAALELAIRQAEAAKAGVDQSAVQAEARNTQAQGGLSLAGTSIGVSEEAVEAAKISVSSAETRLTQAQAQFDNAKQDYERYSALYEEGVIPKQQFDHADSAYKIALAGVESAQNDITIARTRLRQAELNVDIAKAQQLQSEGAMQSARADAVQTDVKQKQYEAALAQVDLAKVAVESVQLQLSYTEITAPSDGRLGKMSVQVGQRISPGQPLAPLVPDDIWVVANFKETQLARIRPGANTTIRVDAFRGKTFTGHVESLSPASGATFALLPPENASGNFTKVVQRFPVIIVFEPDTLGDYFGLLEPGMSVVVKVDKSTDENR